MKKDNEQKLYETCQECMDTLLQLNNQIKELTLQEIKNYKSFLLKSEKVLEDKLKIIENTLKVSNDNLDQATKDIQNINQNHR